MMAMLAGVCATACALSMLVLITCCVIVAKARDTNQIGAAAYGVLAVPVGIASGVLGVWFWSFS